MAETPKEHDARTGLSRRGMLALLGTGAAGVALGAGGATAAIFSSGNPAHDSGETLRYPFYGTHQAGIVTPVQDQLHFAAFDLAADLDRPGLIELLQDWTYAASRLTQGLEVSATGAFGGGALLPPDDTGEAVGISPAGLTITVGFGRSLFEADNGRSERSVVDSPAGAESTDVAAGAAIGTDRFGLRAKLPAEFTELPKMVNDFIDQNRSHGDLCIQACANDPQVAVHAVRNLTRIAFGRAQLRWSQLGFGRTASTSNAQATPRNLFGQKDGTANLKAEEPALLDKHVWIQPAQGSPETTGGSYLVARRISMTIEVWDSLQLGEQERVTGRDKREGAPLSGGTEFTAPDFSAVDETGQLRIDERSHVARTHPDNNGGIRMLRRGYNFVDGNDAQGRLDAGQFFIAYVNDPNNFAAVHKNMARDDMFIEYLKTTGSAVFFVPPGIADGQYIGEQLLTD